MAELDLVKKLNFSKGIALDLSKEKKMEGQKWQVKLAIDISSSMRPLYDNGTVQKTVQRILPLGMAFDDNGEVEVYPFHDGVNKCESPCTLANIDGYVQTEILKRFQYGGTSYAPVINKIMKDFLADRANVTLTEEKSGGMFGMFKKSEVTGSITKIPTLVIFITDGANFDLPEAEAAIREASKHGVFFKFIGIGGARFDFLKKLDDLTGRVVDNADFKELTVSDLINLSDVQLYDKLLDELPGWLQETKAKNIRN